MHEMLPKLNPGTSDFPAIARGRLETLQVNLGYLCNQQCQHCHVNAGPKRTEIMSNETIDVMLEFLQKSDVRQLDLTGGAPELNPGFRRIVKAAREMDVHVIDRCNLTVLQEPGNEDLADFLAENDVEVVASLPCYLEENVDGQRGKGVFDGSIRGLQTLNALGYGLPDSNLQLNLMYNPTGPFLPPPQSQLEQDYRQRLLETHGIHFSRLYTLVNMPIQRFGSMLVSKGEFDDYMLLLRDACQEENLAHVMCRSLLSVDWQGYVYDCDFNQMMNLPMASSGRTHLRDIDVNNLEGREITVADHCYGCTAGQGSSCGGAFE